jgi:hypothetical protein
LEHVCEAAAVAAVVVETAGVVAAAAAAVDTLHLLSAEAHEQLAAVGAADFPRRLRHYLSRRRSRLEPRELEKVAVVV